MSEKEPRKRIFSVKILLLFEGSREKTAKTKSITKTKECNRWVSEKVVEKMKALSVKYASFAGEVKMSTKTLKNLYYYLSKETNKENKF